MNIFKATTAAAIGCLLSSCASTTPEELVRARTDYARISRGPAGKTAPAQVHTAKVALTEAERSFEKNGDGFRTRDLAYVAQRRAAIAEATALITMDRDSQARTKSELVQVQGEVMTKTKDQLSRTRSDLADSKTALATSNQALATSESKEARTAEALRTEKEARAEAEERERSAHEALAKIAAIKDEPRGTVITLSGSLLFASNRAVLLPEAQRKIEQVAAVLLTTRERNLTIEGHTDSVGSEQRNDALSRERADAVRDALVRLGYEPDRIVARGLGEGHPIADNSSAEGRANNRRVEIVIDRAGPLTRR